MALGFTAPDRTTTHRARPLSLDGTPSATYCGLKIDTATWTRHDLPGEVSCQRCPGMHAAEHAALAPFAPGEEHRYSKKRHPGLLHFLPVYSSRALVGYSWRVAGAPRTYWDLARDARAPRTRPWQLTTGLWDTDRVGYFTGLTVAVQWTKDVTASEGIVLLERALRAGIWDAHALNFPSSGTENGPIEETNPT